MKKVYYKVQDGQFVCEINTNQFDNVAQQQQFESVLGGHGIVRTPHENLRMYIGDESEVNYFVGVCNMHGFEISILI